MLERALVTPATAWHVAQATGAGIGIRARQTGRALSYTVTRNNGN